MNTGYLPAIAALAGSAIGGLTSFASAWLTQSHHDRANRLSLLRPVKCDQRHLRPHPGAPELAIMQFAGWLGAGTLSGFTMATNTAKQSAAIASVTRLKTSFISLTHVFDVYAATKAAGRIGGSGAMLVE